MGAEHPEGGLGIEDSKGVKSVLLPQCFHRAGRAQRHRRYPPSRVMMKQTVDIVGLVRAVERARPEVDNAGPEEMSLAGRPLNGRGKCGQDFLAEPPHKVMPRFQIAISRSPLRSAAVGSPDAIAAMRPSKAEALASRPSVRTRPASKSIHPGFL